MRPNRFLIVISDTSRNSSGIKKLDVFAKSHVCASMEFNPARLLHEFASIFPTLGFVAIILTVSMLLHGQYTKIGKAFNDISQLLTPLAFNLLLILPPVSGASFAAYFMRKNLVGSVRGLILFESSYIVTLYAGSMAFVGLSTVLPFSVNTLVSFICATSIVMSGVLSARFQSMKYLMMIFTCFASAELGIMFGLLLNLPAILLITLGYALPDIKSVRNGFAKRIVTSASNDSAIKGLVTWIGASGIGVGDTAFYSILTVIALSSFGLIGATLTACSILVGVGAISYAARARGEMFPATHCHLSWQ